MKKILVVAPFVSLPGEHAFTRFLYLCKLWSQNYDVTLVTSAFCHSTKSQRIRDNQDFANLPFKLVLIDEPGYQKNVSIARFWSHREFHQAFKVWLLDELANRSSWDVIFSAFPLISTNLTLGELKAQYGYKLVIDVQDIWPDSIFSAVPFLKKADILIEPLRAKAHRAYGYADALVAVSQTYLDEACSRRDLPPTQVTYLGSDYQLIESVMPKPLPTDKRRLVYIGTLSHSYDMATIIRGFSEVVSQYPDVELHILGDGPDRPQLEAIAGQGVHFHGYVPYEEMIAFVKACHVVINPIVGSATQSITNKLSDYIAFGLPIVSSQKNQEAMALIKQRDGFLFEAGSPDSFAAAAKRAITSQQKTIEAGTTAYRALDETDLLFDRRVAYPKLTQFLENVWANQGAISEHSEYSEMAKIPMKNTSL